MATSKDSSPTPPPENNEEKPVGRSQPSKKKNTLVAILSVITFAGAIIGIVADVDSTFLSNPSPSPTPSSIIQNITPETGLPSSPSVPASTTTHEIPAPTHISTSTTTEISPSLNQAIAIVEKPHITFPYSESIVDRCITVSGRGLPPDGHDLLIGVQSLPGDSVYVQRLVPIADNGYWDPTRVVVGQNGNYTSKHALLTLSVPKELTARFQSELASSGNITYSEEELKRLGIEILDRTTVTRKTSAC